MGKEKMRCRVEVSMLILSVAFVVSFFGGLNVTIDLSEYWRLVAILEANPNRYLGYVRDALLYLILPPAVGLAFSSAAFIRERKSPTGVFKWWIPLTVFGGFFFVWGVYSLQWNYTQYCEAIHEAKLYSSVDIAGPILGVCATASVGSILWLLEGVLFLLSPVFKIVLHDKENMLKVEKSSL